MSPCLGQCTRRWYRIPVRFWRGRGRVYVDIPGGLGVPGDRPVPNIDAMIRAPRSSWRNPRDLAARPHAPLSIEYAYLSFCVEKKEYSKNTFGDTDVREAIWKLNRKYICARIASRWTQGRVRAYVSIRYWILLHEVIPLANSIRPNYVGLNQASRGRDVRGITFYRKLHPDDFYKLRAVPFRTFRGGAFCAILMSLRNVHCVLCPRLPFGKNNKETAGTIGPFYPQVLGGRKYIT